jgi:hypothetical protein
MRIDYHWPRLLAFRVVCNILLGADGDVLASGIAGQRVSLGVTHPRARTSISDCDEIYARVLELGSGEEVVK